MEDTRLKKIKDEENAVLEAARQREKDKIIRI
jgi:hypothetical protein